MPATTYGLLLLPGVVDTAALSSAFPARTCLRCVTAQRHGAPAGRLRVLVKLEWVCPRGPDRCPPALDQLGIVRLPLHARGELLTNPVPRGLPDPSGTTPSTAPKVPLVRTTRTLPRILNPSEVDALVAALRTHRDKAMVAAMVLGGLRRCEVLGLTLEDLHVGERRVFIAAGKGGHQRLVPVSRRFFDTVADYLEVERPADAGTDRLFLVLKQPRRGNPLTPAGLDEVMDGARRRAGLSHATCHELRHTCLTRLREAGMALEAVQAQAGHASIESTRIYLHLGDDWLAAQYRKAAEAIDAQVMADHLLPVGVP